LAVNRQGQKLANTSVGVALLLLVLALPWILRAGLGGGKAIYWTHILILIAIMILATSSMRAIYRTGEMSLGTAGFLLLGAYSSALLSIRLGLSPWLTMLLGGLFAAAVAALVAYPFFRVKGIYFVICTLLLGFVFLYMAGYLDWLTGGFQGLTFTVTPELTIGSHTLVFGTKTNIEYFYLAVIVVGLCLFVLYRMEHSRVGLVWKSIREADNLAQSVGVNIMAHKVFIFVVACFFTGLAGALYGFHLHAFSPTSTAGNTFHFFTSIYCLMYMVVGGTESFYGPIIGVTLFMLLREFARPIQEYWPLLCGAVLILIVFFMPKGFATLGEYVPAWYRKSLGLFRRKAPSSN
jgi:branched-chain amino acid transport system permease protein